LKALKAFHGLPIEEKMRMAPKHFNQENSNRFHGYFPFLENDISHKEFIDCGRPCFEDISEWEKNGCPLYEENPWTANFVSGGENAWIKETFDNQFNLMHNLASTLISCLAIGLGKREDYFDPWFKDECSSTMRGIHYNTRDANTLCELSEQDRKLVTPEHTDSGFITLLSTFMFSGLEVEINGEFQPIKPVENAIVVNIGDTLEALSGNQIKATKHRVMDIGIERFSSPFFFDPKFSARVPKDCLISSR
jgi:isopenicillin N synthase-like dioxygenase